MKLPRGTAVSAGWSLVPFLLLAAMVGGCASYSEWTGGTPVPGRSYEDFRNLQVELSEVAPLDWSGRDRTITVNVADRRSETRNRPFLHESLALSIEYRVFPFGRQLAPLVQEHLVHQLRLRNWDVNKKTEDISPYELSIEILRTSASVYRNRDFRDVSMSMTYHALLRTPDSTVEKTFDVRGGEKVYPARYDSAELEAHRLALQDSVNLALKRLFMNEQWSVLLSRS